MTAAEQCKDKAGKPTGMPDIAVLQTYAGAAVLAGVVRGAAVGGSRARTAAKASARSRISTATIDYYLNKYGKDALHGVYLIPKDLPSTICGDDAASSRPRSRRASRRTPSSASAPATPQSDYTPFVQAIKSNKSTYARDGLDYVEHRVLPQGGAGAGREHGEGLGLLAAVLRPAPHLQRGLGGRRPVRVAVVPAVRGQGSQRRARRLPPVQQEARRRSARRRGSRARSSPRRSTTIVAKERPQRPHPGQAMLDAIRNIHDFDAGGFIAPTDIGGSEGQPSA